MKNPCVPCSPDGTELKLCTELVHPNADFANLFDSKDGMFPLELLTDSHLALSCLNYLGIVYEFIPWKMLVERAGTVQTLYHTDRTKALNRVKLILQCIDTNQKEKHIKKRSESHNLSDIALSLIHI